MTILNFKYTKPNGSISDRVFVPLINPNTMYEGIDISELSEEQQAIFACAVQQAKEEFALKLVNLKEEFDVKTMYRRFDPTKMSDITKEIL